MRRLSRGLATVAVPAAALAFGGAAGSAVQDHPPPLTVEVGSKSSRSSTLQGEWWTSGTNGCGPIAIDPAGPPRPMTAKAGRRTMRVVYETARRPERVAVALFKRDGERRIPDPRLRPRVDQDGAPRAWVVEFRAGLNRRLGIDVIAVWQDQRGCGEEWLEALWVVRPR